jgi:predicted transcriptional regulator
MQTNESFDVSSAASKLSGLLGEQSLPPAEEDQEEQDAQAAQEDAQAENDSDGPETLENESDTDGQTKKFKVKVDGEELEVDEDELKKGYSREQHYQRKARELAQEREKIEAKQADIDSRIEEARLIIEDDMKALNSPEMLELKQDDPEEYLKQYDKVQAKIKRFESLKSKSQEEQGARREKLIERERAALFEAFPEWSDQEVMQKESTEYLSALRDVGFTDAELNELTDHRFFIIGKRLKQLMSIDKVSLEDKKVRTKPKSVKPGSPATREMRESDNVRKQRERLKKTGSIHDAVKLLQM